jgi:hypothetical protein
VSYESDIRYVRARSTVEAPTLTGSREIASQWHAVIPGVGGKNWPGTACNTPLQGILNWESRTGIGTRLAQVDGELHVDCERIVAKWLKKNVPSYRPPK